jgi:hypothetical protein
MSRDPYPMGYVSGYGHDPSTPTHRRLHRRGGGRKDTDHDRCAAAVLNAPPDPAGVRELEGGINDVADRMVRLREDAHPIELRFQNDGGGIEPARLARVFAPFFAARPQSNSTGLVPCMTHGIVRQRRGKIWVQTRYKQGMMLNVILPKMMAACAGVGPKQ